MPRRTWILLLAAAAAVAQPPAPPHPKVKQFIPFREYSREENQALLEKFEFLRVADVSDGMDVVGLANVGIVHPEIRPLWRDTENYTHRIAGIAVTARYVPTNRREPKMDKPTISRWYKDITSEAFQDVLFPGAVLVIDANEDGESRTIGSNNIMGWKRKGMLGVVTSGGLADSDEIIAQKVPAYFRRYARGIRPGRNELESVNRPITCGGVLVRPGDVVVADGDGVVVVPREHASAVADAAHQFLDQIGLERARKARKDLK
jgi:4-hydroxy-4-methyl-2-oxoglutarate aldolase